MSVAAQEQAEAGLWEPLKHCWRCAELHPWLVGTEVPGAPHCLQEGCYSSGKCRENSVSSADLAKRLFQKPRVFFDILANALSLFFIPLGRKLESVN